MRRCCSLDSFMVRDPGTPGVTVNTIACLCMPRAPLAEGTKATQPSCLGLSSRGVRWSRIGGMCGIRASRWRTGAADECDGDLAPGGDASSCAASTQSTVDNSTESAKERQEREFLAELSKLEGRGRPPPTTAIGRHTLKAGTSWDADLISPRVGGDGRDLHEDEGPRLGMLTGRKSTKRFGSHADVTAAIAASAVDFPACDPTALLPRSARQSSCFGGRSSRFYLETDDDADVYGGDALIEDVEFELVEKALPGHVEIEGEGEMAVGVSGHRGWEGATGRAREGDSGSQGVGGSSPVCEQASNGEVSDGICWSDLADSEGLGVRSGDEAEALEKLLLYAESGSTGEGQTEGVEAAPQGRAGSEECCGVQVGKEVSERACFTEERVQVEVEASSRDHTHGGSSAGPCSVQAADAAGRARHGEAVQCTRAVSTLELEPDAASAHDSSEVELPLHRKPRPTGSRSTMGGSQGDPAGDQEWQREAQAVLGACSASSDGNVRIVRFLDIFDVGGCVGEGRWGKVFKCQHRTSGEWLACKTLRKTERRIPVLQQEINLLTALAHVPNVVSLRGVYEEPKRVHLLLELGRCDLFSVVEAGGGVDEASARAMFRGIMQGLAGIHACGIIHRDIKLENVLLVGPSATAGLAMGEAAAAAGMWAYSAEDTVKITDFGLAAQLQAGQWMGPDVTGSPHYMAPEVALGAQYNHKADVWSAGIVLHALLLGVYPSWNEDKGCVDISHERVRKRTHLESPPSSRGMQGGGFRSTSGGTGSSSSDGGGGGGGMGISRSARRLLKMLLQVRVEARPTAEHAARMAQLITHPRDTPLPSPTIH
ncbi:unnamed protein product [Closterium sp. Yama58-4]|nr:unnamed protein product [Closterium sp. Yama58-4]